MPTITFTTKPVRGGGAILMSASVSGGAFDGQGFRDVFTQKEHVGDISQEDLSRALRVVGLVLMSEGNDRDDSHSRVNNKVVTL
jgi:hypothetical protein